MKIFKLLALALLLIGVSSSIVFALKVYAIKQKKVSLITEWSDLNTLAQQQAELFKQKGVVQGKKKRKKKIVKIELVKVIPKKGNNPFYQTAPVKNTYNPATGVVEARAVDEKPTPSPSDDNTNNNTDNNTDDTTNNNDNDNDDADNNTCSSSNLSACKTPQACAQNDGFWTRNNKCEQCPYVGSGYEAGSIPEPLIVEADRCGEKCGRNFRLLPPSEAESDNICYELVALLNIAWSEDAESQAEIREVFNNWTVTLTKDEYSSSNYNLSMQRSGCSKINGELDLRLSESVRMYINPY